MPIISRPSLTMKNAKKVNPRKRPVSQADVSKAQDKACNLAMVILLTVLLDKFNFSNDDIARAWTEWNKLSEEIKEGRISLRDLTEVLSTEYKITFNL